MFEKEIEFIYNYNLNKIKVLGTFITFEQLEKTDLHPALLQYVSAEIDFLIFEDRQKLLRDSLFDYSGEKISNYFNEIGAEIKRTKKFSFDYLSKLLLHASSFNLNFLIRPKWSLLQFVFDTEAEQTKQIGELKQILNYLYYYPFLKRLIISFLNKKRIFTISQNELKELIEKIDLINYENNFEKVLDNAFKSMIEFINIGEQNNRKISKLAVELFLEDKNLSDYKIALNENYTISVNDKYDAEEYKKIILNFNIDDVKKDEIKDRDEIINERLEAIQNEVKSAESNSPVEEEQIENNVMEQVPENEREEPEEEIVTSESEDEIDMQLENEKESIDIMHDDEEIIETFDELSEEKNKSFLESHIENLDENLSDEISSVVTDNEYIPELDEIEPLEVDESPRIDEDVIEEATALISEEEEVDEIFEDVENLSRVEIDDSEPDPFEDVHDPDEVPGEEETSEREDDLIEMGTAVTFSSDELTNEAEENTESQSEESEEEWPTESSLSENEKAEDKEAETEIEIDNEINKEVEDENSVDSESEKDEEINDSLFSDEELEELEVVENIEDEDATERIEEEDSSDSGKSIDISELLENKKITRIIEVVFDYDMEDFANTIDEISLSKNEVEALSKIDNLAKKNYISLDTKEIKMFKDLISKYFS